MFLAAAATTHCRLAVCLDVCVLTEPLHLPWRSTLLLSIRLELQEADLMLRVQGPVELGLKQSYIRTQGPRSQPLWSNHTPAVIWEMLDG